MSSRSRATRRSPSLTTKQTEKSTFSFTSERNGNPSPTSPSRITRLKEKEDLQNLNDRLVVYIDTVRRLELENSRLQSVVSIYSESSTRDVSEIKTLFERELEDAKRLIDELAKEKARLEIEVSKYRSEADDATTKLNKRDREVKNLEARVRGLEIENQEFKSKNEVVINDNNRKSDELSDLRCQIPDLEKQLKTLKKQLEDETLLRVDLENKNQTLKEDLQFKSQLYVKEIDQLRSSKRVEIEQVDTRLRDEYDSRLVSELQRIRDETEDKIMSMKDEVERRYQSKLADFEANAKRNVSIGTSLREEACNYKSKIEELSNDLSSAQSKIMTLEARLRDVDDKLKRSQNRYDVDIGAKDNELTQLRKEIQELLFEYQELYDVKIALDMEIAAYRKLLESEEQRLNISQAGSLTAALSGSYLATDDQVLRSGKKRRIATLDEEEKLNTSTYTQSAQSNCGIEIVEHDFDGKVVKLFNSTDKDIHIGSWQLKRLADGQETDYKFHKSTIIKPGQHIAVWSSNANITHDPPIDFVMNGQRWFTGDKMITVLLDKDNNEQARRESQRSNLTIEKKLRSTPTPTKSSSSEIKVTQGGATSGVTKLLNLWKS